PCGAGDGHHGPPASPENAQTGAEQRRDTILSCGHPAIRPPVPAFGGDFPESAVRGRDGEPRPGSRPERSGHRSSGNRNGGTVLRCGSPNAPNGFSPYHQSEYPVGRLLRRGRPPSRSCDPSWGGTVRQRIAAAWAVVRRTAATGTFLALTIALACTLFGAGAIVRAVELYDGDVWLWSSPVGQLART